MKYLKLAKSPQIPDDLAQRSIVFTLNSDNQVEEIEYVLEKLPVAVKKLHSISPIWRRKTAA